MGDGWVMGTDGAPTWELEWGVPGGWCAMACSMTSCTLATSRLGKTGWWTLIMWPPLPLLLAPLPPPLLLPPTLPLPPVTTTITWRRLAGEISSCGHHYHYCFHHYHHYNHHHHHHNHHQLPQPPLLPPPLPGEDWLVDPHHVAFSGQGDPLADSWGRGVRLPTTFNILVM